MDDFGIYLLLGLAVLAIPILGVAGFFLALGARRRARELAERVAVLEAALAGRPPPPPEPIVSAVPEVAPAAPPEPEPEPEPAQPWATAEPEPAAASPIPAVAAAPARRIGFEERFAGRWAAWLGSITIGLAAIFLVRYSIEQGLLGPATRVTLGVLLGLALLGASEWLRRRLDPAQPAIGVVARLGLPPANLPPAVAAAGVVALYASVYAGYALHDLIPPGLAFLALGAASAAAMALALLHGPLVAVLGQAAAFAVPALVRGAEPLAPGLFAYVLAVAVGALALARYRDWRWTTWIALAGATAWTLIWWAGPWRDGDSWTLAAFLLALGGAFVALGPAPAPPPERRHLSVDLLPEAALAATILLAFGLARMAGYDAPSLVALLALAAGFALDARRRPALEPVAGFAALLVIFALATWHLPDILLETTSGALGFPGAVLSPAADRFLVACAIAGAAFAAIGYALLRGAQVPAFWAGLGVAPPFALLAIAYWRLEDFAAAPSWSAAALALAGASLAVAAQLARHRDEPGMAGALGVYAVGVTAGVSLAMAATFRLGGLSVALALQIPVLALLAHRLRVPALLWAAAAISVVVLARLAFNPWLLDYPLGTTPILNGLLWMYGVPALAFGVAARAPGVDGRFRVLFEAAALLFAVGLATLEIRHAMGGGRLDEEVGEFAEIGLHATLWLGSALVLHVADGFAPSPAWRWGWRVLAGLGAIATLVVLVVSPLFGGLSVGAWPVFNTLALAYLLPALIAGGFVWSATRRGQPRLATAAGVAALVLGFAWVSFEVARAFRPEGRFGWSWLSTIGQGEAYAYSAAWLAYGAALLAGGIRLGAPALRWAALAVLGIAIAKVFVLDMDTLTGLWRVASFFGLGFALLALGWIYQRFVVTRAAPAPTP